MDFLAVAPPLDPAWLAYEEKEIPKTRPAFSNLKDYQIFYSQKCKELNMKMLAGQDCDLKDISCLDSVVKASDGYEVPIRTYLPGTSNNVVIYFHGGGLRVGDLDSEDLSCRRISKETGVTVISVAYRLLPDHTRTTAVTDAYDATKFVLQTLAPHKVVIVGSSSGGQLAAQVSQLLPTKSIDGVLLRCPVTVDASEEGVHIPARFRQLHSSFSPSFENSLGGMSTYAAKRMSPPLPLEAGSFLGLPRTFIQVCTNDIYYSDGICYAEALREAGVEVEVDIIRGWPHTFWLKAPELDQARVAQNAMIKGLKWLFS